MFSKLGLILILILPCLIAEDKISLSDNINQTNNSHSSFLFKTIKDDRKIKSLKLKNGELNLLNTHPTLDVTLRITQAPYSMLEHNQVQGYFVDILKEMVKGTGITLSFRPSEHWKTPNKSHKLNDTYTIVTSVIKNDDSVHDFIAGTNISIDTILSNKMGSKINSIAKLKERTEILPTNIPLVKYTPKHEFTESRSYASSIKNTIRHVTSDDLNYTILDYPRAQFYLQNDHTNNIQLTKISSLSDDFDPFSSEIGIAIHKKSKIKNLLLKLYKKIPESKINSIKKAWLTDYVLRKPKVALPIKFNLHELEFLNKNKVIKYIADEKLSPFEFYENEKWNGFIVDLFNLFEETTGSKIEYISSSHDDRDKLSLMDRHKAHFFLSTHHEPNYPETKKSDYIVSYRNHYFTRYDSEMITSLSDLENKKVATRQGEGFKYLKENLKNTKVFGLQKYSNIVKGVSNGTYDVGIAPYWSLTSPLIGKGIYNSKINMWAKEFDQGKQTKAPFCVNREYPELISILNKFISALKSKIYLGIHLNWMGAESYAIREFLSPDDKTKIEIKEDLKRANQVFNLPDMKGLTNSEIIFLRENKTIKVAVNKNWLPFSYRDLKNTKKEYEGISIDYLEKVCQKLNLQINYKWKTNSKYIEDELRNKIIDINVSSILTGDMIEEFQHTSPYGTYNFSYVVLKSNGKANEIELNHKKVGVTFRYPYLNFLIKAYPQIDFVKVQTQLTGYEKVLNGELFAYIDLDPVNQYQLRKNTYKNLHLGGLLSAKTSLAFASHKDAPEELISVLNKALSSINDFERKLLEDKWFTTQIKVEEVVDYTILIIVISFTAILVIFFVYWNRKLSRLNEVIKEKESLSRSLLESTNAVPYNFNLEKNNYGYIAPQITKMMGYFPQDFNHEEDWSQLIHPDDRQKIMTLKNSTIKNRLTDYSIEFRVKNKSDHYIWVKDMVNVVYDKNQAIALQGLLLDITIEKNQTIAIQTAKVAAEEAKEAAEKAKIAAEEASQSKSQFLANMSHEIRTPLNPIIGLAHLALTTNPSLDQVKDYMSKIRTSSKSLLRIINDILDLSKMDAEKMTLEEIPLDLHQLNERIKSLYSVKAEEKNINLFFEIDHLVHPYIIGDPFRLEQIIGNLISNAIKFTDKGNVTLKIESVLKQNEKETLCFKIMDTGLGIPKDKLGKIFEVFSQADESNTRTHGGTGLGLNICKELITLMGGDLKAESQQGKGSTFYFSLTFDTVSNEDFIEHNKSMLSKNALPRFRKTRILLAEDNMINKQVAEELLKVVNLDITHVRNGQECLEAVKNGDYELVLMDIQMPLMDGFEATKRIRDDQRFKNLPIIAMTAQAFASEKQQAYSAGMNAHVSKPIEPNQLYETLAKYIPIEEILQEEHTFQTEIQKQDEIDPQILDINAGINRLRGNKQVFNEIVSDFYNHHKNFIIQLEGHLSSDQHNEAKASLHQLKGAAGNIGALTLFEASNELETCLANQQPHEVAYQKFQDGFSKTFKELNTYLDQYKFSKQSDKEEQLAEDPEVVFQQLTQEIQNASPNALATLTKLENIIDIEHREMIQLLKNKLEDYDFTSAKKVIEDYHKSQTY